MAEKSLFIAPGLHSMFVLNKAAENYIYTEFCGAETSEILW